MAGPVGRASMKLRAAHPRARGWLVDEVVLDLIGVGSPARAWMAGLWRTETPDLRRLTRARVDGWPPRAIWAPLSLAHPCARGWLALNHGEYARVGGLTRARVDGWQVVWGSSARLAAHPCARGWLVLALLDQHAVVGSPVRAWMAGARWTW